MASPIEITNLCKRYQSKTTLKDVTFSVAAGEIVGLLGVNGAGKSTLIKCMLDLIEVDGGTIELFGVSHTQTMARHKLSYLGEQFRPPYYATGIDVLKLLAGLDGTILQRDLINDYCHSLDFDEADLNTLCKQYSKGMHQKLGLISCLLADKPLLVLDEPMSGLDPHARKLFKDRLVQQREKQRTVFFSTHLLEDIASICDRVMVIDQGQLRFIGTVNELLESTRQPDLEAAFLAYVNQPHNT